MILSSLIDSPRYGDKVVAIEPYGVEGITLAERHGNARSQFTLWLGSNLTIADYALGFFPIILGMSWPYVIASILVGNVLGGLALALSASMGPGYGLPQLMITRFTFGKIGGYIPAAFNYISTIGWFTVNNILGTFGLQVLLPHLAFWQGAIMLVVIQSLLAIYGHNLIHLYEKIMSVVLGLLFLVVTIIALSHQHLLVAYQPHVKSPWVLFVIMVAAAFSYIGSWSPYASDYSRYLAPDTKKRWIGIYVFLGSFIASVWLELLGAAVAVLVGNSQANPIAALHTVMGSFGVVSVIAIILGGTAADALNLYSNALAAGALDIRLPRWTLTLVAGVIGLVLSLLGSGGFEQNYDNFLLLLGYWMTPWMGVLFADFFVQKSYLRRALDLRAQKNVNWPGLVSFVLGIIVSIPFMDSSLYEGVIAKALNGMDFTFYVGFLVAFIVFLLWNRHAVE